MKLKCRCGNCGDLMKLTRMPQIKLWTCRTCDRVAVIAETKIAGDMFEARMKAQGFHRSL